MTLRFFPISGRRTAVSGQEDSSIRQMADKKESIFKNKNFIFLWAGQTISILGDNLYYLALMWWVLEKTGSTAIMATVAICSAVPSVVLGPIAGTYADRVNRKRLLISMDLGRAILISLPAVLLLLGGLQVWHILIISALLSTMSTFFGPALSAFIPLIVETDDLTRANSLTQFSMNMSGILGPSLAGVLIALIGSASVMFLDALSFFISAVAIILIFVKKEEIGTIEKKEFLHELKEGFVYIRNEQVIFSIVLLAAVLNFFVGPVGIYMPVVAKEILKAGAQGFGFLASSVSVGGLLASLLLSIVGNVKSKGIMIILGIFLGGWGLAFFGISSHLWLSLLLLGLVGMLFSLVNILIASEFQTLIPNQLQGRVFGTMNTLSMGLRPLSLALAGVLSDLFKVQLVIFASGVLIALGGIYGFFIKSLRKL
jgi:DHA3 family macrolide efflux protein-like MFS transporter